MISVDEYVSMAEAAQKERDREAIASWGLRALGRINPDTILESTIRQEIAKLQNRGKENATT